MNNTLIFTKYLYNKDEVELTLMECILKNDNFEEVYYWTRELYDSNNPEEIWQLLYKIYYDFYFLTNQKFENKMNNCYLKWKKKHNIGYLIYIVYNLCRQNKNIDVNIFIYRTYFSSVIKYIIQNINLSTYSGNTRYEKLLNYAIKNKNNEFIAYYLKKCHKLKNIETFLTENFSIDVNKNEHYSNKFHLLLCSCLNFPKTNKKFIYKKVPDDAYNDVVNIISKNKSDVHWKVLREKRLYKISETIGCFKLVRSNYKLNKEFWYNWEYHAYNSTIWKDRFDKYKIKLEAKKKLLTFLNDDEMEDFYSKWGYEPDEQPKEVQEKSIKYINSNNINIWIKNICNKDNVYKIEKKIKY